MTSYPLSNRKSSSGGSRLLEVLRSQKLIALGKASTKHWMETSPPMGHPTNSCPTLMDGRTEKKRFYDDRKEQGDRKGGGLRGVSSLFWKQQKSYFSTHRIKVCVVDSDL